MKLPYAPGKRATAKLRWWFIILLVSSPIIVFLWRLLYTSLVVSAVGMVSLGRVTVNAPGTGVVQEVVVNSGESVGLNATLVRIANPELDFRLSALRAEEKVVSEAAAWSTHSVRGRLEASLTLARKNLDSFSANYQAVRKLTEAGAATIVELRQAQAQRDQAALAYNIAAADLESTRNAPQETNQLVKQAQLGAQIEDLKTQIDQLKVTASAPGQILEIYATQGQALGPGSPLLLMSQQGVQEVMVYADPIELNSLKDGSSALVRMPDGGSLSARLNGTPELARRLPTELASAFTSVHQVLQVRLALSEPLPERYRVNGLPVKVFFEQSLLESLRNMLRHAL